MTGPGSGARHRGPSHAGPPSEASGLRRLGAGLRWGVRATVVALAAAVVPGPWSEATAATGVALLLSAPYLATVSAAVLYARRRRWLDTALAVLLLAFLLAGLAVGTGRVG